MCVEVFTFSYRSWFSYFTIDLGFHICLDLYEYNIQCNENGEFSKNRQYAGCCKQCFSWPILVVILCSYCIRAIGNQQFHSENNQGSWKRHACPGIV